MTRARKSEKSDTGPHQPIHIRRSHLQLTNPQKQTILWIPSGLVGAFNGQSHCLAAFTFSTSIWPMTGNPSLIQIVYFVASNDLGEMNISEDVGPSSITSYFPFFVRLRGCSTLHLCMHFVLHVVGIVMKKWRRWWWWLVDLKPSNRCPRAFQWETGLAHRQMHSGRSWRCAKCRGTPWGCNACRKESS